MKGASVPSMMFLRITLESSMLRTFFSFIKARNSLSRSPAIPNSFRINKIFEAVE